MSEDFFSAEYWDDRYSDGRQWSGKPNPTLVAEVADLVPGSALDVGCGEGGDAIWLAEQGWQVTGLDVSGVALRRAAGHSGDLKIEWVQADLRTDDPPGTFDLVTAHYMQLPAELRVPFHHRLAAAVNPGGTLLIVAHDVSDLDTGVRRPMMPGLFFTADEVVASLPRDGWDPVVTESRPRLIPDGITIHDVVVRVRRR